MNRRTSIVPSGETQAITWGRQFITAARTYQTTIKLTKEQIDAAELKLNTFATSRTNAVTLKAQARAAVTTKDANLELFISDISTLNNLIQSTPNISEAIKQELGLKTGTRSPVGPPHRPLKLSVKGRTDGVNLLKWNRNGNIRNATFYIEAKYDGTNEWKLIDTTTGSRYEHRGQTIGIKVQYRVRARRRELYSEYSETVTAYSAETSDPNADLRLAA